MYKPYPFLLLSITSLLFSTLMALSSTNWLFLWIALELNLLSFIPLILSSNTFQETEASVKYFLTQALGSSILLMSSMSMWFSSSSPQNMMSFILFMALVLKIGMAPCHLWYPSVMTSISWLSALILSTWQKLAPISIMTFMVSYSTSSIMILLAGLNALVGGVLGMNQSHLRTILAYSSITHMGWMLALMSMNMLIPTMMYFMFYMMIVSPIFIMLYKVASSTSSNINKIVNYSPLTQMLIPMILLSLGGLPPLTGFMPKWLVISLLCNTNPFLLLTLILGSMMNMYYYLNLLFTLYLSTQQSQNMLNIKTNSFVIASLSLFSLFLTPLMI